MNADSLNKLIADMANDNVINPDYISDGYHTFKDLYYQRLILSAALCEALSHIPNCPYKPWRSKRHSDGSEPFGGGYFIMGFRTPKGDFTYHYKNIYWHLFSSCETLVRAPKWDGHTSVDVDRLLWEHVVE